MSGVLPTGETDYEYDFASNVEYVREPSYTRKLNLQVKTADGETSTISGHVNGKEAFRQAVFKLLSTERYDHAIYSTDYGVELRALIGMPIYYVVPEIERRITEAVMQDDRTVDVYGFEFDTSKRGVVSVKFNVSSIFGDIEVEKDVEM